MLEKLKEKKFLLLTILVIYIGMYIICRYNLFAQDEYNYSHITWTNHKLQSFNDIFISQKEMYTKWSGRIPVQFMTQTFLFLGTQLYDLLNPIVFILFIAMIIKISGNKIDSKNLLFVLLLSLFGAYKFWQKYIWISGSLNYLWPVTLMLIVIYYIYNMIIYDKKFNILNTILLFITSFFAGWSHENVAFVLGSFIIFICLFNLKKVLSKDNKEKFKIVTSILLFGIGAILLIFCPGNFARLNESERHITLLPVLKNVFALYKVIILYVVTVIVLRKSKKINETINTKDLINKQIKYFIYPLILAILPMIIIAEFPVRAALAYEVLLFIIILSNMNIIYSTYKDKKYTKNIAIAVSIISIILLYTKSLFAFTYLKPYKEKIESQIENQKSLGKTDIVVSEFDHLTLAKVLDVYTDIFPKETDNSINNSCMATYYGVNTITAIKNGYVQVEIAIPNEKEMTNYNVIDKTTNEIISKRIEQTALPVVNNSNLIGRIIFNIPINKLDCAYIDLPDDIKQNITQIKLKSLEDIDFNVDNLLTNI